MPKVCSVLESLEQEYRRDEDWCGGRDKLGPSSEIDHVIPLISKHLEQKEAFLKVQSISPVFRNWGGGELICSDCRSNLGTNLDGNLSVGT